MKKELAISHDNSNLKSCHNFQCDRASSPVSRNYVHLNLSPIPCKKDNCIGKKSIILISIPGPLIYMVQHWWDTLKQERS
jgi:hypothetical protein